MGSISRAVGFARCWTENRAPCIYRPTSRQAPDTDEGALLCTSLCRYTSGLSTTTTSHHLFLVCISQGWKRHSL